MLNYNTIQGAPGLRILPQQLHPTARAGGLMYYPFSAIVNGLGTAANLSAYTGVPAATLGNSTITVGAGAAYLDGEISSYTNAVNGTPDTVTLVGDPASSSKFRLPFSNLVFGYNEINLFLNPTRLVIPWGSSVLPTSTGGTTAADINRLNGGIVQVGDIIAQSMDHGDYYSCYNFWLVTGVATGTAPGTPGAIALSKYDPTFAPPTREGRMRTWGNQMEKLCRSANLSLEEEKRIFIATQYPPYVNSNSQALLRDPASLALGTLRLFVYTFPIELRLDLTQGDTTVTLDPETAAILANTSQISVRGKSPSSIDALGAASVAVTISGNNLVLATAPAETMYGALCEIVATTDAGNAVPVKKYAASAALSSYTPAFNNIV